MGRSVTATDLPPDRFRTGVGAPPAQATDDDGTHAELPPGALTGQLRGTGSTLDELRGGDAGTDVRTVISWSYQALGTGAARVFRLLRLHQGPDIGVAAVASLAGIPSRTARSWVRALRILDELPHHPAAEQLRGKLRR